MAKIKLPASAALTETSPEIKLSKDDPALKAFNSIAEILDPLDRAGQLKALAAACSVLGMTDYAIHFLKTIQEDQWRNNV